MTGSNRRGIVMQERDRRLLRELWVLRVADRELVKVIAGFHSTSRVNARLLALTLAGFLKRFFLGTSAGRKALYSLTRKGAAFIQMPLRALRRAKDETLVADFFIEHQLAVNRLYCALKFSPCPIEGVSFTCWKSFDHSIVSGLHLIPDGYVELGTRSGPLAAFIEVDLGHESLSVWRQKVRNYVQLATSGEYEHRFANPRFRVCVIAQSERRVQSIRKAVAALTEKLFWFTTLDNVERNGFFNSIWLRPRGDERQAFLRNP